MSRAHLIPALVLLCLTIAFGITSMKLRNTQYQLELIQEDVKGYERYSLWINGWIEGYKDGRNGKPQVTVNNIAANNPEGIHKGTDAQITRWLCGYRQGYRDGNEHDKYDYIFFHGVIGVSMRGDYGNYNHCDEEGDDK